MGFASTLFFAFRILQGILSLVTLGCGAYIANVLKSFAADANDFEDEAFTIINNSIVEKSSPQDTKVIEDAIKGFVNVFVGPPSRGYFLIFVSIWSLLTAVYLLVAQQARNYPRLNSRIVVISLELSTTIFWFAGFIAIASVVAEYQSICVGFEAFEEFPPVLLILEEIPIINNLLETCSIGIVASVVAAICWTLWFTTSIAACCVSSGGKCCGGKRRKNVHPENGPYQTLVPMEPLGKTLNSGFNISSKP